MCVCVYIVINWAVRINEFSHFLTPQQQIYNKTISGKTSASQHEIRYISWRCARPCAYHIIFIDCNLLDSRVFGRGGRNISTLYTLFGVLLLDQMSQGESGGAQEWNGYWDERRAGRDRKSLCTFPRQVIEKMFYFYDQTLGSCINCVQGT